MSLQLVANHLAQKGRGPDSTLVHMSNREVAGLQALAQKHGGQLSVNPDTGLPEAGFLDNLLPMVAGAGLTYFSGGAINPLMAGGIIGGITALDSKDLSKGLVAGLGAYGGAGMVGGLAGLGAEAAYMPGAAGEAARAAGTEAAITNGTYQSQVGTGLGNFIDQPMNSLSTLGGGSVLKGSLPILAGLAPAAAEAFDEEEGDEAPAQHKGYIRKYALDPVTGQYKQVGAYEAGGDPNVDVSSKAGTAGAFGGVGQSEYEAAQGMAAGGATDSSRIYDYLMGRGENPMQFRHTTSPQVNYNIPKPPEPITPTTPILDPQFDQYGNRISSGGGGNGYANSPEGRAEREAQMDKLRAELGEEGYAKRNDWIGEVLSAGPLVQLGKAALNYFKPDPNAYVRVSPEDQFKDYIPGDPSFKVPSFLKSLFTSPISLEPSYYSKPGITDLKNPIPDVDTPIMSADDSAALAKQYEGYAPPQGDPAQQQAAQIANELKNQQEATNQLRAQAAEGTGTSLMGRVGEPGGPGSNAGGGYGGAAGRSSDGPGQSGSGGWGRGATGGLATPYGVEHMAQGGIANLYNLGSYSDGGRLLKGPGDGVSDDIPATIGHGQPARLADGEFVIPARIVSEIGNGSTDAGARELYKMMDRVQAGRKKTVGKDQVAKNSKAVRHLPA